MNKLSARVAGFAVVSVAFASFAFPASVVSHASGAVNCPTGTGQFIGTWEGDLVVGRTTETTDYVHVWGELKAQLAFNSAKHSFAGTVTAYGLYPTDPARPLVTTANYSCVTGEIFGFAGGGKFGAEFENNNTGIRSAPKPLTLIGYEPYTSYDNFTWSGGLQTSFIQEVGTQLNTDPDNSGATPTEPEQVEVESPTSGALSIAGGNAPNLKNSGYYLLGPTVHVVAPMATPDNPLALTFTLDATAVSGQSPTLFRDGAQISACATQPATTATPDPCVSTQTQLPGGDWQVVVLSTHASVWSVGVHAHAPGKARVVSVTPGKGKATVKWGAPSANGGATVRTYVVTPYLGKVAKPSKTFKAKAKSGVVTGLTNGKSYTFTVAAANLMGKGPKSAPSAAVSVGAPAAPTAVKAVRSSAGTLSVSFKPPADNGAAITGYSATCAPSPAGAAKSATGSASPVSVSGLAAGKTYTCRVSAKNSRGSGPLSTASGKVQA